MKNLDLERALKAAVACERNALAQVLRLLREVEKRKLFLERGYSSLFAYCTGELGYSESEAYARIQSMRLMRAVPEVEKKIEKGELSLTVASMVQGAAKREGVEAAPLVEECAGLSKREAEKKLAGMFPEASKPEVARPISEDRVEIRFSVSREEYELLQKLLDRKAHTNFERKYETLFLALAKRELEKIEGKQTQDAPFLGPGKVESRHIPNATRRAVWRRDQGRCQYRDPVSQQLCQERHGLQLDHIKPYAQGGAHAPENLRLLCGAHNRFRNSG